MAIYVIVALAFLTHIGFAGSRLAVPLFAIDDGASPFVVGTVVALYAAFPTVLSVPAGRLADRLGFKPPLIFGTGGVLVALLLPFIWPSMTTLYFTASLIGLAFMALQLATQTLAGLVAGPDQRARNFSLISLGFACANLIGPLVTGFLIDEVGYAWTFGALAVPLVPALILSCVKTGWMPAAHARHGRAGGGTFDLLKIKPLRDTLIASGIVSAAWDVYQFFMPIYGRSLDLSATAIGAVMSAFAVSIILVRMFLPFVVRRAGEVQLMTYAMFVAAVAFALFPVFSGPWMLGVVSFVLGIGCGCGQPLSMTLVFNASPKGRVGEATAMRIMVNQITHLVIPLVFGAVGSVVGFTAVFLTNAGGLVAGGYLSLRNHPKPTAAEVPK
jgi:MFS family permease